MKPFAYSEPAALDEAVALLASAADKARILAGGTDLLVLMKEHVIEPQHVVNIKKLPGLDDFGYSPGAGLRIGALVTVRQVETSPVTLEHYASLAKAATDFASIQVRNRATLVGNVCRASPSADTLPPLVADRAVLHIHGPAGRRSCTVEEFCVAPGRTTLAAGEIVTHVEIPAPAPRTGKVYIKHGRRQQMELATVGVAAHLTLDGDGAIADAAVVLASVAPRPLRSERAEAVLRGAQPADAVLQEAARLASEDARPISDIRASADYRRQMVQVLTRRALERAVVEARA